MDDTYTAACKVRHILISKYLYCSLHKDDALFRSFLFVFFVILLKIRILLCIKDLEYEGCGLPADHTQVNTVVILALSMHSFF